MLESSVLIAAGAVIAQETDSPISMARGSLPTIRFAGGSLKREFCTRRFARALAAKRAQIYLPYEQKFCAGFQKIGRQRM